MTDELYRRCPDCLDSDPAPRARRAGESGTSRCLQSSPDIAVRFASTP